MAIVMLPPPSLYLLGATCRRVVQNEQEVQRKDCCPTCTKGQYLDHVLTLSYCWLPRKSDIWGSCEREGEEAVSTKEKRQ